MKSRGWGEEVPPDFPREEVIERYEGGESVNDIAKDLWSRGVLATSELVDMALTEQKIIRHADPGKVPADSPQGFTESVYRPPVPRPGEGSKARRKRILGQIVHEEVVIRYRDKGESLETIMGDLRRRGTDASVHYLAMILKMNDVPLRRKRD